MADGICMGVPVANGYPTAPPLPASTTTTNGHFAPPPPHTGTHSDSELTENQKHWIKFMTDFGSILFISAFIIWFVFQGSGPSKPPSFQVQSVSVLFDKSNDSSHATWNLGLSVKSGEENYDEFDYNDLDVLFRSMSSNWSRTVVAQSSNNQDPKNMTSLSATVVTSLFQGSMLEFDVMFRVKFVDHKIEAVCNNLTVGFSPHATEGMMEGGPRLCDYH